MLWLWKPDHQKPSCLYVTQAPVKIDKVMVGDIVVEKQVEAKSSYGEDDGLVLNLGDLQ